VTINLQIPSFQAAVVKIPQQSLAGCLAFTRAALEGRQLPGSGGFHPVSRQHVMKVGAQAIYQAASRTAAGEAFEAFRQRGRNL
jgi:hypothetical protein